MGCPSPEGGAVRGVVAFIGIGANMGSPAETCRTAVGTAGRNSRGQASPLLFPLPDGAGRTAGSGLVHQCRCGDPDEPSAPAALESIKGDRTADGQDRGAEVGAAGHRSGYPPLRSGGHSRRGTGHSPPGTAPAALCPRSALRARLLCDPSRLRRLRRADSWIAWRTRLAWNFTIRRPVRSNKAPWHYAGMDEG